MIEMNTEALSRVFGLPSNLGSLVMGEALWG